MTFLNQFLITDKYYSLYPRHRKLLHTRGYLERSSRAVTNLDCSRET